MGDSDVVSAERRDAAVRAGRALGESRNYRGAVEAFRQALGQDPNHVEAHYLLGLYLHNLGRHAEALTACRAAVAIEPGNAIAHRLLGIVLGAAALTRLRGIEHLDEAVRLSPQDGYNHYYRARALAALRWTKGATAAYLDACRHAPDEAQILAGTAEFLLATWRIRKGRDFAARAFAAAPDDLAAVTVEARSRLIAGRFADARDLARAAVAMHATYRPAVEVLIEAEMCRNPVFAVWSRCKSWCLGGKLRGFVLLIAWCHVLCGILVGVPLALPGTPQAGVVAFALGAVLPTFPGVLLRRRIAAALKPVVLTRRF